MNLKRSNFKEAIIMSTSLLYHAFQIEGVKYKYTSYEGNHIIFKGEINERHIQCPVCKSIDLSFKGKKERRFSLPPLGKKSCFLDLKINRIFCKQCSQTLWPHLPFMKGKSRMSRSFINFALDLLTFGTIKSVADFLKISWDCVKDIHKEKLKAKYNRISISECIYLSVDEFAISKGHKYMTIFSDVKTGEIVHAIEGKDKKAIIPFLKKLAKKAKRLKAIAMDMSNAFYSAVKQELPHVDIVFDHFHVMQLMTKSLDEIRREQQNILGNSILKGNRFLLLKNYEDLDVNGMERLKALLTINEPLFIAHTLKEQLRGFWMKKNKEEGRDFLKKWCLDAILSGNRLLRKTAKTIWSRVNELLNYFIHPISNGRAEGINNKIKTMKRQAYGFRDIEYFKLRLYHLHNQRYSFTG